MSDVNPVAVCEVVVPNIEGLHARPAMRFVELASRFQSEVSVTNSSRGGETVDGKSAMQMMLLEATKGCVLRIVARGADAHAAAKALEELVRHGFKLDARSDAT